MKNNIPQPLVQKECIHSRHCKYSGCKYGEEDCCPVYLGYKIATNDDLGNRPKQGEFKKRREWALNNQSDFG